MTTKAALMRTRIAGLDDEHLIESYGISARDFAANPQGKNADAHIMIMGMMDFVLLDRPHIPCCDECSVPLAANFHIQQMHDMGPDTPAGKIADALTDAAVTAAAASRKEQQ